MGSPPLVTDADRLRWRAVTECLAGRTVDAIARYAARHDGRVAVAWSGGKDSTVLAALARRAVPGVEVVWSDDEAELACHVDYVAAMRARWGGVTLVAGPCEHAGWWSWSTDPPLRQPLTGTVRIPGLMSTWLRGRGVTSLIGSRAGENAARRRRGAAGAGWWAPLWSWTDADVWAAIAGLDLPLTTIYQQLVGAGWPRERCRTVPLPHALGGRYGPWERLWPAEMAAVAYGA